MDITIHVHSLNVHTHGVGQEQLGAIFSKLDTIMGTLAEATASLNTLTAQVTKIGEETRTLLQKIADLTALIEAGSTTGPEFDAALAALQSQVAVVDGLVPDA